MPTTMTLTIVSAIALAALVIAILYDLSNRRKKARESLKRIKADDRQSSAPLVSDSELDAILDATGPKPKRSGTAPVGIRHPIVPKIETPVLGRHWTFLAGIGFATAVGILIEVLLYRIGINFNAGMHFGLAIVLYVLIIYLGTIEVGGLDESGKFVNAGFKGVMMFLDAPVPKPFQYLLPPGKNWVLRPLMSVESVPTRELAVDIPPTSDSPGFQVDSINFIDPNDPSLGRKYVPMLVKARIRKRITDPYKWVAQDRRTNEKNQVSLVVQTMREIATNGTYPNREDLQVKSDFELMQKKNELSVALTEDIKGIARDDWGEGIIDVIVRQITPADPALVKRYQQVAQEIADRDAQSLENKHIIKEAERYKEKLNLSEESAMMYAMLLAGKTTLDNIKTLGGAKAFVLKNEPSKPPTSPSAGDSA